MSYYNIHPVFGHRASTPTPSPYRPLTPPGHHHHHASPFATPSYDLEEEERAALAHLRHIQQRREAQQAAIEREAAIRLREQEERELAIRRAIAEKRREQVIAEAIARQREEAIERARIHAAVQQRHQAELQHRQRLIEHQQQQRAAQLHAARQQHVALATERAKRCAAKYAQRATQQVAKEVKKEYRDEYAALNNLLGNLFGVTLEDEQEVKESKPKVDTPPPTQAPAVPNSINDILSQFLGIHIEPAPTAAPSQSATTEPQSTAPAVKPQEAPQEVKPAPTPAAFPEDVNDLLSHFLGLRIEPTTADKPSSTTVDSSKSAQTNEVPSGLNEFLSRFGLVFEPLDVEQESKLEASQSTETKAPSTPAIAAPVQEKVVAAPTSVADPPEPTLPTVTPTATAAASSSQPRAVPKSVDEHPLTTFLNGMADMPPFVRDILGNVEMAFKEERDRHQTQSQAQSEPQGKGKGVAPGEKKVRVVDPTPAPAPTPVAPTAEADPTASALSTLSTISSDLDLVRRSFDFPSTLSFASPSSDSNPPALLFNKANSGYHAQAHKLLQLLLAADAITSDGNKDVRRKRKEVVREVEQEIEGLEKRRDQVWEEVKAQRERGEVEVESESSSCASSVVDPTELKEVEHHEEVEGFEVPAVESEPASTPSSAPSSTEPAAATASTSDSTASAPEVTEESATTEADQAVKTEDKQEQAEDQSAKVDKDEGYELL